MTQDNAPQRKRNRTVLIAIFAIFFGAFALAGILRFSGWQPSGTKNHGELLKPPGDLRAVMPVSIEGGDYRWNPTERVWRIAVATPTNCMDACVKLSRDLDTVWQLFGPKADHVHILWIGAPPPDAVRNPATRILRNDAAIRAGLPRADDPLGIPVYVVDPNGFVILRYAPGFDPAGLREDMAKLLKLM